MFWFKVLILAVVGAIIGWITNVLAIKLIFRPFNPYKIPLLNFKIQGLIPKRREEIAKSIGLIVEKELISIEEIFDNIVKEENKLIILMELRLRVERIIEQRIPSLIPSVFKNMIVNYVDEIIVKEGENLIDDLKKELAVKAREIKISELIEEKINNFELTKLEELIISIAKRELRHIEILGGILGFIIGLIQGLIVIGF